MKRLLTLILLLVPSLAFAQGVPISGIVVTGPNGQPRPGATLSFCVHPATLVPCTNFTNVYSDIGLTILINQAANPIRTDGLGNAPTLYTNPGIIDYTISGTGISTPNGPYVINVALAANGNNAFSGNNTFSGTNTHSGTETFTNFNQILWAGPGSTPTIDTQITACGSVNPCQIFVSTGYTGTFPPVNPITSNIVITDYHAPGPSPVPLGTNTDTWNGQTPGVTSFLRHSWLITNPANKSHELTTNLATFTGTMPAGTNSFGGITSVALTTGTITSPGVNSNLVGFESHAYSQSSGGTFPNFYGLVTNCGIQSGSTNITNCYGGRAQAATNTGTGTITNAYGWLFDAQTLGITRNFSWYAQGGVLLASDATGTGINFEDSSLVARPILTALSATNVIRFRSLLDSAGFQFFNQASSANWLTLNSAGLSTQLPLTSTLATGTAPFVIASTTLVPNLNTQVLNGVTVTGTPTAGQVPTATSGTAAAWAAPAGLFTAVNVTPVTVSANTAADQNLMAMTITAGSLNSLNRTLLVQLAGVYSTPAASTSVVTVKLKLCTVSGCGSGTVLTLANISSTALGGIQATNDPFNLNFNISTQTAGASAAFEAHGNLTIDITAFSTSAESVFADINTATVGTVDSTATLFLQTTIAFSNASASNTATQRQMIADTVD